MSEGRGAHAEQKKTHTPGRCFFFAPRALCSFLEKDGGFPEKNIGCNVFYRRPRVFLYKTYEYSHLSRKFHFFSKIPTTNAEQKKACMGMFCVSCIVF